MICADALLLTAGPAPALTEQTSRVKRGGAKWLEGWGRTDVGSCISQFAVALPSCEWRNNSQTCLKKEEQPIHQCRHAHVWSGANCKCNCALILLVGRMKLCMRKWFLICRLPLWKPQWKLACWWLEKSLKMQCWTIKGYRKYTYELWWMHC